MPSTCVVLKCKTGYKSLKVKRSLFKVPRSEELSGKWKDAIPRLKKSSLVCERHFKEEDIIRKYCKYDENGRKIAEVFFKQPRLSNTAIPTIFTSDDGTQHYSKPVAQTAKHSPINKTSDVSDPMQIECKMEEKTQPEDSLLADVELTEIIPTVDSQADDDKNIIPILKKCKEGYDDVSDAAAHVRNSVEGFQSQKLSRIKIEVPEMIIPTKNTQAQDRRNRVPTLTILGKSCTVARTKSNDKPNEMKEGNDFDNNHVVIPPMWSVVNIPSQDKQFRVFTCTRILRKNNLNCPLNDRHITLDGDKKLRYFIHGHPMNPAEAGFVDILSNNQLLPDILRKFQHLSSCVGVGNIDLQFLNSNDVFEDCFGEKHSNACLLVSKQNRCDDCRNLRKNQLQKAFRFNRKEAMGSVHKVLNTVDQKKWIAMKREKIRSKRKLERAKLLIEMLKKSLAEKEVEIDIINGKTLDEKCAELNIPPAQRIVLNEIIKASSTAKANGRRYKEEWVMLCLLMNMKSPSYYEFLRENNILPLPCTKTIRKYFALGNVKFGFDESFAELLETQLKRKISVTPFSSILSSIATSDEIISDGSS